MRTIRNTVTTLVLLSVLSACTSTQRATSTGASDPNVALIERHVQFANAGDTEGILSQIGDGFVWYEVTTDGLAVAVVEGREQLREFLNGYFEAGFDTVSTITPPLGSGAYYSTLETTSFTSADGPARQNAHTVYEIRDGRIRNVWYFPATRLD